MIKKIFLLTLILFLWTGSLVFAQDTSLKSNKQQEITDILDALAEVYNKSIIYDETVSGKASFYFYEAEFEDLFRSFLKSNDLYYTLENNVYHVSRCFLDYNKVDDLLTVHSKDVPLNILFEKISKSINKTIVFDRLPTGQKVYIHQENQSPETVLNILIAGNDEYSVKAFEEYYRIVYEPAVKAGRPGSMSSPTGNTIKAEMGKYSINLPGQTDLRSILKELFKKANKEFVHFFTGSMPVEYVVHADKSFKEMLTILCQYKDIGFIELNEVYYVYPLSNRTVAENFSVEEYYPLTYLNASTIQSIIPYKYNSKRLYSVDANNNAVLLSGPLKDVAELKAYIVKYDVPVKGRMYHRIELNHFNAKNVLGVLPQKLKQFNPTASPDDNAIILHSTVEIYKELLEFIESMDRESENHYVKLRYIKAEDLLKNLPPSITKEDIRQTSDPTVVFISSGSGKFDQFLKELEVIDKPVPQIRYELIIIQYLDKQGFDWESSFNSANSLISFSEDVTEGKSVIGDFSKLMYLGFDVVSSFGYQFASNLSVQLSENDARVLADTTLNGLSGQKISFFNTSTFRYRQIEIDPDTNEESHTGPVQEISSGLKIEIDAWASGDGMITMDVRSEISQQGNVSESSDQLPVTSEKVVTTHVRSMSGEPIVIGGLIQEDSRTDYTKVPILGDIPLLGMLFRSQFERTEKTELVIYLVPFLETDTIELNYSDTYEAYFKQLIMQAFFL